MRPTLPTLHVASAFLACSSSNPAGSGPTSTPDASIVDSSIADSSIADATASDGSDNAFGVPDATLGCTPLADAGFDSLSTFPVTTWCAQNPLGFAEQRCGSFVRIEIAIGVDCGQALYFDATSGALVANVMSCSLVEGSGSDCTATTSTFEPPATCTGPITQLCPPYGPGNDGGSEDAGDASDAGVDE